MPDSAGVWLTQPLVLGINLGTPAYGIDASALSIPITAKNADFSASATGADIGTTWPLVLGLQLATSGSSAFAINASALSIPITAQSASTAYSGNTTDAAITWPLSLGFLLAAQSYTLDCTSTPIYVAFSDSSPEEFTTADQNTASGGYFSYFPDTLKRTKREIELQDKQLDLKNEDPVVNAPIVTTKKRKITVADLVKGPTIDEMADEFSARRRKRRQEEELLMM